MKNKGWKDFVYLARLSDARMHRAMMRSAALRFREEIAPDGWRFAGEFCGKMERAAQLVRDAVFWRNLARQSEQSAADWKGGAL